MQKSVKRRVKIVCTLGPSTQTEEKIFGLIQEGMDVARLNFSHGTHAFHSDQVARIRAASARAGKPVAIMQDLQGPKIRVGKLGPNGLTLHKGQTIVLHPEGSTPQNVAEGRILIPVSKEICEPISKDTQVGARILFDDGKIAARAISVQCPEIIAEVEVGGKLTDHKGMNFPGTPLSIPCLTDKDIEDLKFGVSLGVDAIALSFVRDAEDIAIMREHLKGLTNDPPLVVAKIEREEAVINQDSIIDAADGLLVARGDMAVEIGAERVPIVQKQLIHACNQLGVFIITATQMLESMIGCPTPTRAEASDVANAVFDGTDAVMLSGETASGQYPLETVQTMSRIILEAEGNLQHYSGPRDLIPTPGSIVESIEFSASRIAHHVGAEIIVCMTRSGVAARALAKFRPDTPILAFMDNETNLRKLAFTWGVRGLLVPEIVATDDLFALIEKEVLAHQWAAMEDLIVVTAGIPTLRRGTTNMVKVHRIGSKI